MRNHELPSSLCCKTSGRVMRKRCHVSNFTLSSFFRGYMLTELDHQWVLLQSLATACRQDRHSRLVDPVLTVPCDHKHSLLLLAEMTVEWNLPELSLGGSQQAPNHIYQCHLALMVLPLAVISLFTILLQEAQVVGELHFRLRHSVERTRPITSSPTVCHHRQELIPPLRSPSRARTISVEIQTC